MSAGRKVTDDPLVGEQLCSVKYGLGSRAPHPRLWADTPDLPEARDLLYEAFITRVLLCIYPVLEYNKYPLCGFTLCPCSPFWLMICLPRIAPFGTIQI